MLEKLSKYAIEYQPQSVESLRRNHHMNKITPKMKINQDVVDAVLVDFINFIGVQHCVDYAMYTSDLPPPPGPLDKLAAIPDEKRG